MPYGVGSLLLLGFLLYCLIDVIRTGDSDVRGLPKLVWVLLIVLLPLIGGIAWLLAGRPEGRALGGTGRRPAGYRSSTRGNPPRGQGQHPAGKGPARRRPAPDDDPEFLRQLDERLRRRPRGDDDG